MDEPTALPSTAASGCGNELCVLPENGAHDDLRQRTELCLRQRFDALGLAAHTPRLKSALEYALFPGGLRLRPTLVMSMAMGLGIEDEDCTSALATAIELMHCASLVHDDLPYFDDAILRRGRPSLHRRFDEATAVLVGDSLIVAAFEVLARAIANPLPELRSTVATLVGELAESTGARAGLIAGQAMELEPSAMHDTPIGRYHRAKTAALFELAASGTASLARALGHELEPARFRALGRAAGEAYQLADDLLDTQRESSPLGKPVGQDLRHGRPNAVVRYGTLGARDALDAKLNQLSESCRSAGFDPRGFTWLELFEGKLRGALDLHRSPSPGAHTSSYPPARRS